MRRGIHQKLQSLTNGGTLLGKAAHDALKFAKTIREIMVKYLYGESGFL